MPAIRLRMPGTSSGTVGRGLSEFIAVFRFIETKSKADDRQARTPLLCLTHHPLSPACGIVAALRSPRAPLAHELFKLRAVRFRVNEREPERDGQPSPRRAVNLHIQLLDSMFGTCLQTRGRQVFPVLVTGMLNARRGLGASVDETADRRFIQRA